MADKATNGDVKKAVEELGVKFDKFVIDYHMAMYGDAKIGNGDKGLIGNVRDLKDYMDKYPSIRWYMAHKPKEFWATMAAIFALAGVVFIKESRDFFMGVFRGWFGF